MPWLTPDTPPDNQSVVRRIVLPADVKWTAIFDGMLLDLCYRRNWETDGTMSPQDMADWWWSHYNEFTTDFKETPYSDGPADLDGEPTAPWYENLYDWVIAGFLAFTFTPGAAIVYQATVPKLRIAFRTGNIGALFKVLINGVEIWSGDSYAPIVDVLEQVFDTSAYTAPYTVRVEHNGTGSHGFTEPSKLEYIRQDAVADMVQTILRADPAGCGIQWSLDNGGTWDTIDLAECIAGIAQDKIEQAVTDGTIPSGGQAPQEPPTSGNCRTYRVKLSANSAWVCPSPLKTNDTVIVQGATGAWNDGSGFGAIGPWFCPDGSTYAIGQCHTDGQYTDENDPLPSEPHMSLIGHISEYFNPFSTYVVPSGVTDEKLVIQANDPTIADNLGEVEFQVTVCTVDGRTWQGEIPVDGNTIAMSFNTIAGYTYHLTFEGTYSYWNGRDPALKADAFWAINFQSYVWDVPWSSGGNSTNFNNAPLRPSPFPGFQSTHVYEVDVLGTGAPFIFGVYDPVYDNSTTAENPFRVTVVEGNA